MTIDEQLEFLRKGAVEVIREEDLRAKLLKSARTGKPLRVKLGADPTAPDIHLGHTVVIRKLRHFQELGHTVIFLIGDFTGLIGDPSGKSATRPQLSREEIAANAETYKKQIFKLLDPERTEIRFNSEWMDALGSDGFIRLASHVTVKQILERDDFQKRLAEERPVVDEALVKAAVEELQWVEYSDRPKTEQHHETTGEFAPAQFFTLDDATKLSRPSFEPYPAGAAITLADAEYDQLGGVDPASFDYDMVVVDPSYAGPLAGSTTPASGLPTALLPESSPAASELPAQQGISAPRPVPGPTPTPRPLPGPIPPPGPVSDPEASPAPIRVRFDPALAGRLSHTGPAARSAAARTPGRRFAEPALSLAVLEQLGSSR